MSPCTMVCAGIGRKDTYVEICMWFVYFFHKCHPGSWILSFHACVLELTIGSTDRVWHMLHFFMVENYKRPLFLRKIMWHLVLRSVIIAGPGTMGIRNSPFQIDDPMPRCCEKKPCRMAKNVARRHVSSEFNQFFVWVWTWNICEHTKSAALTKV